MLTAWVKALQSPKNPFLSNPYHSPALPEAPCHLHTAGARVMGGRLDLATRPVVLALQGIWAVIHQITLGSPNFHKVQFQYHV